MAGNFEQRDNSGSLFVNDRKTQANHPDYQGQAMIDNMPFWVSAWVKTSASGKKYMSMAFKPKEDANRPANPVSGFSLSEEMNDSLPF